MVARCRGKDDPLLVFEEDEGTATVAKAAAATAATAGSSAGRRTGFFEEGSASVRFHTTTRTPPVSPATESCPKPSSTAAAFTMVCCRGVRQEGNHNPPWSPPVGSKLAPAAVADGNTVDKSSLPGTGVAVWPPSFDTSTGDAGKPPPASRLLAATDGFGPRHSGHGTPGTSSRFSPFSCPSPLPLAPSAVTSETGESTSITSLAPPPSATWPAAATPPAPSPTPPMASAAVRSSSQSRDRPAPLSSPLLVLLAGSCAKQPATADAKTASASVDDGARAPRDCLFVHPCHRVRSQ